MWGDMEPAWDGFDEFVGAFEYFGIIRKKIQGVVMQMTLNIPDFTPLALNIDIAELQQTIKQSTALMLYKKGKFSIEQASAFAGMNLYDFMEACANNEIPVIQYQPDELALEMQMMSRLRSRPGSGDFSPTLCLKSMALFR